VDERLGVPDAGVDGDRGGRHDPVDLPRADRRGSQQSIAVPLFPAALARQPTAPSSASGSGSGSGSFEKTK
jgi:hypothetical protein